jgi:hypothetical protein
MKTGFAILCGALGLLLAPLSCAQIALVMSAASAQSSLSHEQAAALFLGKSFNLPNNSPATLIDQPETAPIRADFYGKLTGKSLVQVKGVWMRLVFSGKGSPPTQVANTAELIKMLQANPNALGYMETTALDDRLKVLFVLE